MIRAPKTRLIGLFILSLLFVALGVWLLLRPESGMGAKKEFAPVLGAIAAGFFGLCGGMILRKLIGHRIVVIVDRLGVVDNSSATPVGRIVWDEITKLEITSLMGQRFLGIDVRDRAALYSRARAAAFLKANANLMGFPVNINGCVLDRPLEDLYRIVERYWQIPNLRNELESFEEDSVT